MCLCFAPMPVGRREKSLNCELETRNFKRKKKTKTLGGRGVLYPLVSLKKKKKMKEKNKKKKKKKKNQTRGGGGGSVPSGKPKKKKKKKKDLAKGMGESLDLYK